MKLVISVIWDMNDPEAASEYVIDNYIPTHSESVYPDMVILPDGRTVYRVTRTIHPNPSGDGVLIYYKPAFVVRLLDNGDRTAEAFEVDMPTLVNRNA